jgi:hypothetical protein
MLNSSCGKAKGSEAKEESLIRRAVLLAGEGVADSESANAGS